MMAEGDDSHTPQERKHRLPRACTARTSARLAPIFHSFEPSPSFSSYYDNKYHNRNSNGNTKNASPTEYDRNFATVFATSPPSPSQRPRWLLCNMWELASILNFFHVFRPVLNLGVEFTAEEVENALITPNDLLADLHIPMLKAIPPVIRAALRHDTWVTVMCKKLRDWWCWVAEGDLPLVPCHGEESLAYKELDPSTRVLILKALCEIRVQQEDVQTYIERSLKHGTQVSTFRMERIGGDARGTSFWYEADSIIGHRLYREIRKVEVKNKVKVKGSLTVPVVTSQWETIATNFTEFQDAVEKLSSSRNKMECNIAKRLNNDVLPQLEVIYKRKVRTLKKQQRQRSLLDGFQNNEGPSSGRSLRHRKPVTYTFDDFDRSITEAINVTKRKQSVPEPRQPVPRKASSRPQNIIANGKYNHQSEYSAATSSSLRSGETDAEQDTATIARRERTRRRPQRYSEKEFVEAVSDNEADFDSDDEIVGEAIYDEEYLKMRKRRKGYSSSEGDEEYREEENVEEDEVNGFTLSTSQEAEEGHDGKWGQGLNRKWGQKFLGDVKSKEQKLKYVDEIDSNVRRSKRAIRHIDYSLYDASNSDEEKAIDYAKPSSSAGAVNVSKSVSNTSNSADYDMESDDSQDHVSDTHLDDEQSKRYKTLNGHLEGKSTDRIVFPVKEKSKIQTSDMKQERFIDLNEIAPFSGFDDGSAL